MKRIKKLERKLRHNCPTCSSTYTLLETHLSRKDLTNCSTNCLKAWEGIIHKYCQEKEVIERKLENKVKIIIRDENSFAYTIINEEGITTEQVFGSGSTKFGYHATVVGGVIPFVNAVALVSK